MISRKALGHTDVKLGVARNAEFLASFAAYPVVAARQFVVAGAAHAFHDFGCACGKRQVRRQYHANRLFTAVGIGDAVTNAFTVKVNVGQSGDADVVDFFSGHES